MKLIVLAFAIGCGSPEPGISRAKSSPVADAAISVLCPESSLLAVAARLGDPAPTFRESAQRDQREERVPCPGDSDAAACVRFAKPSVKLAVTETIGGVSIGGDSYSYKLDGLL